MSSIIDGLTCQQLEESNNAIVIDEVGESCEHEKTLNECCISCKIGLMTPSEKCSQLVNFLPSKGQLISKCPFSVIIWTKRPTKKFDKFCPRIYKVVKSAKIKALSYNAIF